MRVNLADTTLLEHAVKKQVRITQLSMNAPCGCVYNATAVGNEIVLTPWGLCALHSGDKPLNDLDAAYVRLRDLDRLSDEARKNFLDLHRVRNVHK